VPQRRRRVFVVGCLGDWERAAQVLFERESVQRDSSTRRAPGQGASADAEGGAASGGWMPNNPGVVSSVCTKWSKGTGEPSGSEHFNLVAQPVAGKLGNRGVRSHTELDGHGAYIPVQPFTKAKRAQSVTDDETWVQGQVNPTLSLFDQGDTRATTAVVNMQGSKSNACVSTDGTSFTLNAMHGHDVHAVAVAQAMTVRRLTARECERLQAFPDDYTLIPWRGKAADQCPDGPRYKALGNSMAVNCMEWIGERIDMIEKRNSPGV
jgi:DNA (cytosine-5)-methyltransferase 1